MTSDIFGIVQYLHRNYLPENYRKRKEFLPDYGAPLKLRKRFVLGSDLFHTVKGFPFGIPKRRFYPIDCRASMIFLGLER